MYLERVVQHVLCTFPEVRAAPGVTAQVLGMMSGGLTCF